MRIFKKKFYINRPVWIFANDAKVHISGCYVNGVFDPENAYRIVNKVIESSKEPIKVIY